MKFVYIRIPVTVDKGDELIVGQVGYASSTSHTLSVPMFVPDAWTHEDAVERFGEALQSKLNTVDIGDDT